MGLFDNLPFVGENKEEKILDKQTKADHEFQEKQQVFQAGSADSQDQLYERETRSDLIRWQQDLEDELHNLVQTLLGRKKVNHEWIQTKEKLCNEKFISELIIPQCQPFISRNLINSNFEESRILNDLKNTVHDIIDAMSDKYDEYGIEFTNFDLVLRHIKNTINPGPFRALKGWTKKMDSTMIKRIESSQEQQQQPQKQSIFGAK